TGRSADGFAAASPPMKVTPGTVRSASSNVATFFSLITSWGTTAIERGVSMSGAVNLYDGSVCVCMSERADAFTCTAGKVAAASALAPLCRVSEAPGGVAGAACAMAAGAASPVYESATSVAIALFLNGKEEVIVCSGGRLACL